MGIFSFFSKKSNVKLIQTPDLFELIQNEENVKKAREGILLNAVTDNPISFESTFREKKYRIRIQEGGYNIEVV